MKCSVCSMTEESDIGSVLIYLDKIKEVCFSFSTKITLLNRDLKTEKELRKKTDEKLQQSIKENKSPQPSVTPQAKRKKNHETSDLFAETPDISLNDSNYSNGSLNMGIKNESIEDSFIACSQVVQNSPVKRSNRIKKEVNSPLQENNHSPPLEILPKRPKSKWISKANLENSLRKSSTPEKSFLKPPKFVVKTVFSTKMKQQTLDQMKNKPVVTTTKIDNHDDDSMDATYCPELNIQPVTTPSKSDNKTKDDNLFAFTQVKKLQKTVLKEEPCSSKPKVKNILGENKFKTTTSPDNSKSNSDSSSCFYMPIESEKVIVIDESQSGDEHFSDGVLTRQEKECLKEYEKNDDKKDCHECAQYMKYIRGEIKDNKPVDQCSKHTNNFDTPDGFWDPFFPATNDVHRSTLVDNRFIGLED